jgi:hypothetical protein
VITAELIGDTELLARLDAMPGAANQNLARAITRLGLQLQRYVQADKLSGQVLKRRTGILASSINTATSVTATSVTATVGTLAKLHGAAAHEMGFHGTVNVKASLRRIKEAFGRPIAEKTISVRAHAMHMNLPERSFLRSALADMRGTIEAGLQEAVDQAVRR